MALRVIAFAATLLLCTSCTREVEVEKQMTWNCGPKPADRPSAALELRYVEDPHYIEYVDSRETCEALQAAGREVVRVRFRVWSHEFRRELKGYTLLSIDGRPPRWSGQQGGSAHEGEFTGPHPLEAALR